MYSQVLFAEASHLPYALLHCSASCTIVAFAIFKCMFQGGGMEYTIAVKLNHEL